MHIALLRWVESFQPFPIDAFCLILMLRISFCIASLFSSVLANKVKVYGTHVRSFIERYKKHILHVI